jgi:DNA primase
VIVVEGYMDVVMMHQHGFTNAVASMGTSITEQQIKDLFRYADSIYFMFDGDNEGKKAGWRSL